MTIIDFALFTILGFSWGYSIMVQDAIRGCHEEDNEIEFGRENQSTNL